MADIADDVIPELIAAGASDDALGLAKACMNQITPDTYSAAMRCIVTFEGRDNLPRITRPTLVLAGDQDRNAPAPMMEKMASKIPGAEYVLLTDTGHLAPIENAQGFNSTVLEFVQRHQLGLGL
jgi:3-oxoadipate enol-lactonase